MFTLFLLFFLFYPVCVFPLWFPFYFVFSPGEILLVLLLQSFISSYNEGDSDFLFYLCLCGVGAVVQLQEELSGPSTKQGCVSPKLREKLVGTGHLDPEKQHKNWRWKWPMTSVVTPTLFSLTKTWCRSHRRHHSYPFGFKKLVYMVTHPIENVITEISQC